MATKSKTRKNEFEKTATNAAAADFEAWTLEEEGLTLEVTDPHLMMARLAYALMHKSKTELVDAFRREDAAHMDVTIKFVAATRSNWA